MDPSTSQQIPLPASIEEPEFELPPEIWKEIFHHLTVRELLRGARLTCRCWRDIVDQNKSLVERFLIKFPEKLTLDETYRPASLIAGVRVWMKLVTISNVDSWWPSFGSRLTSIRLRRCRMSLETLLGMLRQTPNLAFLALSDITYTSVVEPAVDFRLDKMKTLETIDDSMFNVFVPLFPMLKALKMSLVPGDPGEQIACRLIESVQGTLKHLGFCCTPTMLHFLSTMNQMQLETVTALRANADQVIQLSQMQPSLEQLHINGVMATNSILCEIGRKLPRLKRLTVGINENGIMIPSFLATMPLLDLLTLKGSRLEQQFLNIENSKSPNLKTLWLYAFDCEGLSLQLYLASCVNLSKLTLEHCTVDCWSNVFSVVEQLPSLHTLELRNTEVLDRQWDYFADQANNLEVLHLYGCNLLSNDILTEVLTNSPRVHELYLRKLEHVNDGTVLVLCHQLKRLKNLTLGELPSVTDVSAGHITEHCSKQLERLHIFVCKRLSKAAKEQLALALPNCELRAVG